MSLMTQKKKFKVESEKGSKQITWKNVGESFPVPIWIIILILTSRK